MLDADADTDADTGVGRMICRGDQVDLYIHFSSPTETQAVLRTVSCRLIATVFRVQKRVVPGAVATTSPMENIGPLP